MSSTLWVSDLPSVLTLGLAGVLFAWLAVYFNAGRVLLMCFIGFAWSSLQFDSQRSHYLPDDFEQVDIMLTGTVVDLPSDADGNWRFRLRVDQVEVLELQPLIGQRVQLSCYDCPFDLSPGQQWRLNVRLKRPYGYASPGAFDYQKYLFRHRVVARGHVRVTGPAGTTYKLYGQRGFIVNRWREAIRDSVLPSNQSVGRNMISALTIGDKSSFTVEQKRVFQETGVSHLMAISGLHISLVFLGVSWLFKWLLWPFSRVFERIPRQHIVLLPAMVCATFYAGLAGFAVSTQRALIMLVVLVVCKLWLRQASLFRVLLIAVVLLLGYDPFSILDIGFWLSAGAVFCIALFSTENQSLLRLQPRLWFGMLPMTSLFFGQVSLVSPLVNLVMVPLFCMCLIPLTLFALLLTGVGLEWIGGELFALLGWVFDWLFVVLEYCVSWRYAAWYTSVVAWWQWCLVLLVVGLELLRYKWRFILWPILVASFFLDSGKNLNDDELKLALLDVGQGLAMVIRTSDFVMVYDTGPRYRSGFSAAQAVLLPYLRQYGISKVDHLIVSHADNDHIGGLQVLLDGIDVERVSTSRLDKIPFAQQCEAGQSWRIRHTEFTFLSPDASTPLGSNNHSCVLKIRHQGSDILISGDIEKQVERYLVSKFPQSSGMLTADILLVPHQGSKTSSTELFLQAVTPKLALVAAGYRNHYGHPHPKVVQRYHDNDVELLSTIDSGTIEVTVDKTGWRASSFRASEQRFWH